MPDVGRSFSVDRLKDPRFRGCALGSILATGRDVHSRRRMTSMRRFGRYAVVYVSEGNASYLDDAGLRCALGAGDLIVVFPDLPHLYGPAPWWSEQWIVFDGPLFRVWEQAGILNRDRPIVRVGSSSDWVQRLRWITAAGVPTNESAALRELVRLQEVLAEMLGVNPTWRRSSSETWIEQARVELEQVAPPAPSLAAIAEKFHVSLSTFRRRFRAAVDVSPKQYRMQSMIRHAQVLMLEAELSDKQIARKLGFVDAAHFSKRFKQHAGVSPRQYRRSRGG